MHTLSSLHEYRLAYPSTSPVPTLTQRGMLASLLRAECRRADRRRRRQALRAEFWRRLAQAGRELWQKLAPGAGMEVSTANPQTK